MPSSAMTAIVGTIIDAAISAFARDAVAAERHPRDHRRDHRERHQAEHQGGRIGTQLAPARVEGAERESRPARRGRPCRRT